MTTLDSNGHRPPRPRRLAFVLPRAGWLLCTLLATVMALTFARTAGAWSAARPAASAAAPSSQRPLWYLRSGQWCADARSAMAAARYLLEAEPAGSAHRLFLSVDVAKPTNGVASRPKGSPS